MTKDLPPSRTAEQFVVRFPEGMRDRIAAAAKENNRSMNAEIVARLDASFSRQGKVSDEFMAEVLKVIREAAQELHEEQAGKN